MRSPVRPRSFEPRQHSPVGSQAQAIVRERRACAIAYELLELTYPSRLLSRNHQTRMQIEALDVRLQRPKHTLDPASPRLRSHLHEWCSRS